MGKRKFLVEDMQEWTDYELEFVQLCADRKWIVDKAEDGTPVLNPSRKKNIGTYHVAAHGYSKGNVLMGLLITAEHGRTKESLLRKAENANLNGDIFIETDTDVYYLFPIDRLARAVKTFNLRRKQKHPGPPKDAIAKGQAALKKWREEQQENKNASRKS